jgi:hypothetical protein
MLYGSNITAVAEALRMEASRRGTAVHAADVVLASKPHRFWCDATALRDMSPTQILSALSTLPGSELVAVAEDRHLPMPARSLAVVVAMAAPIAEDEKLLLAFGRTSALSQYCLDATSHGVVLEYLVQAPRGVLLEIIAGLTEHAGRFTSLESDPLRRRSLTVLLDQAGPLQVSEFTAIHKSSRSAVWALSTAGAQVSGGWLALSRVLPNGSRPGAVLAGVLAGERLTVRQARSVFVNSSEGARNALAEDPMLSAFVEAASFDAVSVDSAVVDMLSSSEVLLARLLAVAMGDVPADIDGFISEVAAAGLTWRTWVPGILWMLPLTAPQVVQVATGWPYEAYLGASHHVVPFDLLVNSMMASHPSRRASWLAGSLASPAPSPDELAEFLKAPLDFPAPTRRSVMLDVAEAVAHPFGPGVEYATELLRVFPRLAAAYAAAGRAVTREALFSVFAAATLEDLAAACSLTSS